MSGKQGSVPACCNNLGQFCRLLGRQLIEQARYFQKVHPVLGMISILSGCHEFLMAFTVEELKDERPAVDHLYLGRE